MFKISCDQGEACQAENDFLLTGNASLRVDCVLGQGAFATVYQATDPATSARMVLKVRGRSLTAGSRQCRACVANKAICVLAGAETSQSLGVLHQHTAGRQNAAPPPSPVWLRQLRPPLPQRERPAGGAAQLRHSAGTPQRPTNVSMMSSSLARRRFLNDVFLLCRCLRTPSTSIKP